ncbi:MAG: hypothetical protein HOV80_24170 [Polyangiaceae bacterium]|nr:hypothetical protein [Polyangiaceae bacterium]
MASAPGIARADPLPTNAYDVDLFQGPLLAPIRATSLAGAYAGYAEGTAGMVTNAAAPAVRPPEALRHVEFSLSGSLSFPIDIFDNNDFDNSGEIDADYSDFVYLTGGAILQVGAFGGGLLGELQSYSLTDAEGSTTNVVVGRYRALAAVGLGRDQLALGGGVRAVTMGIGTRRADLVYVGAAPELGFLVRPEGVPFRFGATYRFPVDGHATFDPPKPEAPGLPSREGALTLPRGLSLPWELETGVAIQVGPRPLNVGFDDPADLDDRLEDAIARERRRRAQERERILASISDPILKARKSTELDAADAVEREREERALEEEYDANVDRLDDAYASQPRQRLLLLISILVSGPTKDGVSLERFLAQSVEGVGTSGVIGGSGASVNFSPRFGVEVEPIPSWLILRAGSYYEPSRFGGVGRQHFTFGSEVRLFETDIFGLTPLWPWSVLGAVDLSPRYQSVSVSLGVFR